MKQKPQLTPEKLARLQEIFDQDLTTLGSWLGTDLTCDTFKNIVKKDALTWR